jgi:hypothetical protein
MQKNKDYGYEIDFSEKKIYPKGWDGAISVPNREEAIKKAREVLRKYSDYRSDQISIRQIKGSVKSRCRMFLVFFTLYDEIDFDADHQCLDPHPDTRVKEYSQYMRDINITQELDLLTEFNIIEEFNRHRLSEESKKEEKDDK